MGDIRNYREYIVNVFFCLLAYFITSAAITSSSLLVSNWGVLNNIQNFSMLFMLFVSVSLSPQVIKVLFLKWIYTNRRIFVQKIKGDLSIRQTMVLCVSLGAPSIWAVHFFFSNLLEINIFNELNLTNSYSLASFLEFYTYCFLAFVLVMMYVSRKYNFSDYTIIKNIQ